MLLVIPAHNPKIGGDGVGFSLDAALPSRTSSDAMMLPSSSGAASARPGGAWAMVSLRSAVEVLIGMPGGAVACKVPGGAVACKGGLLEVGLMM
jgi:hypothetical protein